MTQYGAGFFIVVIYFRLKNGGKLVLLGQRNLNGLKMFLEY